MSYSACVSLLLCPEWESWACWTSLLGVDCPSACPPHLVGIKKLGGSFGKMGCYFTLKLARYRKWVTWGSVSPTTHPLANQNKVVAATGTRCHMLASVLPAPVLGLFLSLAQFQSPRWLVEALLLWPSPLKGGKVCGHQLSLLGHCGGAGGTSLADPASAVMKYQNLKKTQTSKKTPASGMLPPRVQDSGVWSFVWWTHFHNGSHQSHSAVALLVFREWEAPGSLLCWRGDAPLLQSLAAANLQRGFCATYWDLLMPWTLFYDVINCAPSHMQVDCAFKMRWRHHACLSSSGSGGWRKGE